MPGNWFVALAVPAEPWFARVGEPPTGVRRFHPDDLHITVAFLGACGQSAAEAAFELAPKWPTDALDITLADVEPMGNPRRPNAFAAIVREGAETLSSAILSVRDAMCARAGARIEERRPKPHVTIARPRRAAKGAEMREAMAWARGIELQEPRVHVSQLVLYTHATDRAARLFHEHAAWNLDSGGGGGIRRQ